MAAKMTCLTSPPNAFVVQTLSCREALSWLKTNGYQQVVVESDSFLMVFDNNKSYPL